MNNEVEIKKDSSVRQFGEVFTPDSIVCDMIDLVEKQWGDISDEEYILKTYLEPACGDGQFLIRLLERKLNRVKNYPVEERELALVKAVSSLYGVDIQKKNVNACKNRMLDIIYGKEVETFDLSGTNKIQVNIGIEITNTVKDIVYSVINANIIEGNALESIGFNEYEFKGDRVRTQNFYLGSRGSGLFDQYTWKEYVKYTQIADLLTEDDDEFSV